MKDDIASIINHFIDNEETSDDIAAAILKYLEKKGMAK